MMDLDSAIQHCKEQVQEQAKKGCYSCAEDHQQLAEWLKELKEYREQSGDAISRQEVLYLIADDDLSMGQVVKAIHALPSVTPQQGTGRWILADEQNEEDVANDNYRFICSECQCSDIHAKGTTVPYCWNCGAKMEVKK